MRRKVEPATHNAGRGRSLIATRTSQAQQKTMQGASRPRVIDLPRSYSSPSHQTDGQNQDHKDYVSRSLSTPDPNVNEFRRHSDFFYRPKCHGSRSELDSDLEHFEQFEECFTDMEEPAQSMFGSCRRTPEREQPKRVVASLLPGSGLQRVPASRPISSSTCQSFRNDHNNRGKTLPK